MDQLTPREIVTELDKYIIGQAKAKRAVAIALRNRWRRQQISPELRDEVAPKNIIMIGRTGIGKTEIARRLAKLAQAPFLKVEASKFTEVGYVGRDVDSMIRDLVEIAVNMVKNEETKKVQEKAKQIAEEKVLDILIGGSKIRTPSKEAEKGEINYESSTTRETFRKWLHQGILKDREIELEVKDKSFPMVEILGSGGMEVMDIQIRDMLGNLLPRRTKSRKVSVEEAIKILTQEEAQKLIDMDKVIKIAISRVENSGIIFIDEIDKIAGREKGHGPDVSREGVQRDLLPIIEGSTVTTKYGVVKTDHILFIAAGAFHVSKPSDLIPELQGRFPIRVELTPLGKEEFIRILKEPENALIKQYIALMATENVKLSFTDSAIEKIAELAALVNSQSEDIGARRLHTIMENLLDDISFEGPGLSGREITIDASYVQEKLSDIVKNQDLSRYIL